MPFTGNDALPKGVKSLSPEQQTKWRKIFNSAYEGTCKDSEDRDACASKVAWSQMKSMVEMSMVITKAALDPKTGEMRWSAVNSDTDEDSYGESMTLELFNNFIHHAESHIKPPKEHCTDYWCGGMPYLSVAHYRDQNGLAVPGEPKKLYVDGNRLKSSGIFYDNELGRACFKAARDNKNLPDDEKVRISIGFLDLEHAHGEVVFRRRSVGDICPMCLSGVGNKRYLDGILVHLALTRVPVNTRTIIEAAEVEKSMADEIRTRKDDAASIIGDELAEDLDKRAQTFAEKSQAAEPALVERSEPEEPKETEPEKPVELAQEVVSAMEAEQEKAEPVEKSDAPLLPFSGATSWEEYESYVTSQQEAAAVYDAWYTMEALASNVMACPDCEDKKGMMAKLLSGCKKRMEMKSLIALSKLENFDPASLVERSAPAPEPHPLDELVENLKSALNEVTKSGLPLIEKLQAIQPEYSKLGEQVKALVEQSEVKQPEQAVAPAPADGFETLRAELRSLSDAVAMLTSQMTVAKAPTSVVTQPPHRNAAANQQVMRTLQQLTAEKPGSLKSLVRKSVGLY